MYRLRSSQSLQEGGSLFQVALSYKVLTSLLHNIVILLYIIHSFVTPTPARIRASVPPLYLMTSEIWGIPPHTPTMPLGPDSTDSLLHTNVIANRESQGWLVPDS